MTGKEERPWNEGLDGGLPFRSWFSVGEGHAVPCVRIVTLGGSSALIGLNDW